MRNNALRPKMVTYRSRSERQRRAQPLVHVTTCMTYSEFFGEVHFVSRRLSSERLKYNALRPDLGQSFHVTVRPLAVLISHNVPEDCYPNEPTTKESPPGAI